MGVGGYFMDRDAFYQRLSGAVGLIIIMGGIVLQFSENMSPKEIITVIILSIGVLFGTIAIFRYGKRLDDKIPFNKEE